MASKHVAVWPKVRVFVDGKSKIVERGETVPAGVATAELDNLVAFGAIAGVTQPDTPKDEAPAAETPPADTEPTTIKGILEAVGDDKAKAQEYLDAERAKGDDARPTLVEKLEAIVNDQNQGS